MLRIPPHVLETLTQPNAGLTRQAVEELARRREEPDWLRQLRLDAFEAFQRLPLADEATGNWRRADLSGLKLEQEGLGAVAGAATQPSTTPSPNRAGELVFHDGTQILRTLDPALEAKGVRLIELREALHDPRLAERVRAHFAQVVAFDEDKLTALHYALFNSAAVVFVPRNVVVDGLVTLRFDYSQAGLAALSHTLVIAEENAQVAVEEIYSAQAGAAPIASGVVEAVLEQNAHVRYGQIQAWDKATWCFSYQRALLAQDSALRTLIAAVQGRHTRNAVQVILNGRGSQADLLGVVAGAGRQHVDFQTLQDHFGDGTRSDLVIHNALDDRSSSNFTGLIRINKQAHGTESSQEQKNLLLSDKAKADSDPKLEILNNDVVRCTHGAAVGPLDEELLFFLGSRGLDRDAAQRLVVEGFYKSVLAKLDEPAIADDVWSAIQGTLGLPGDAEEDVAL